jgi:hypothetical protein
MGLELRDRGILAAQARRREELLALGKFNLSSCETPHITPWRSALKRERALPSRVRQEDLAKAAKVGLATIARIEQGEGMVQGNFSTVAKIQQALEREGISFTADQEGGIGVRLEKKRQRR